METLSYRGFSVAAMIFGKRERFDLITLGYDFVRHPICSMIRLPTFFPGA
jgi:hypothetical protein